MQMTNVKISNRPKLDIIPNSSKNTNNKAILNIICQQGNPYLDNEMEQNLLNELGEEKEQMLQRFHESINNLNALMDSIFSDDAKFNAGIIKFKEEVDKLFKRLEKEVSLYINKMFEYIKDEIKKKVKNFSDQVRVYYYVVANKILNEAYEKAKNNRRLSVYSNSSFSSGFNN
jgi:hypothetical protein